MQTRVSNNGEVTLPESVLRQLGFVAGDTLDVSVDSDGRIALKAHEKRTADPRIIKDPITGWPVLSAGAGAPILTSEQVAELLVDFP